MSTKKLISVAVIVLAAAAAFVFLNPSPESSKLIVDTVEQSVGSIGHNEQIIGLIVSNLATAVFAFQRHKTAKNRKRVIQEVESHLQTPKVVDQVRSALAKKEASKAV